MQSFQETRGWRRHITSQASEMNAPKSCRSSGKYQTDLSHTPSDVLFYEVNNVNKILVQWNWPKNLLLSHHIKFKQIVTISDEDRYFQIYRLIFKSYFKICTML